MTLPQPRARVRLIDDAVVDLQRLHKKDPEIVRAVIKKLLLLERSPEAGSPLRGALVGFRKLVVGDRHFRIIWRETFDDSYVPVLEIAEVWAVGVRSESQVYEEMKQRVNRLKQEVAPHAEALAKVVEKMGLLYTVCEVSSEPQHKKQLPDWLQQALRETLHLSPEVIGSLSQEQAQHLLTQHWSQP